MVAAGLIDDSIDLLCVIELAFLWLELRPGRAWRSTVLRLASTSFGQQLLARDSRLVAVLFNSSPETIRKGLPSTINCVAVPLVDAGAECPDRSAPARRWPATRRRAM